MKVLALFKFSKYENDRILKLPNVPFFEGGDSIAILLVYKSARFLSRTVTIVTCHTRALLEVPSAPLKVTASPYNIFSSNHLVAY